MGNLFIIQAVVYGFTLWFGLYLLVRSGGLHGSGNSDDKPGLYFAGLGLIAYALGLAAASLNRYTDGFLTTWYPLLALLPAGFWYAAAWSLLPEAPHIATNRLIALLIVASFGIGAVLASGYSHIVLGLIPLVLALAALWWVWRAFRSGLPHPPLKVLFTATLFFALGCGLVLLPTTIFPNEITLLAIGGDVIMLGFVIAKLDAYDEGTALLPDALRSLAAVGIVGLLIGGQMAVLAAAQPGLRSGVLFYTALSTVILTVTWYNTYQKLLDRWIFGEKAHLTAERETLNAVSDALPRLDQALNPLAMDESEFTRLTRRALSHYNDLGKLTSSPLTRLPAITERLHTAGQADTSLERAHELRRLLAAHILRLKPYSDKDFDTGDDWRYYNALYFPYILGLKPYNVRSQSASSDPVVDAAVDWFQTYVPERTLYNWQNAAARLIARQLRETDHAAHAAEVRPR